MLRTLVTAELLLLAIANVGRAQEFLACPSRLQRWLDEHPAYSTYVVADAVTAPRPSRTSRPRYAEEPAGAVWEGTAVLVVAIDTTGKTVAADVLQASVHPGTRPPALGTPSGMTPAAADLFVRHAAVQRARAMQWERPQVPTLVCMAYRWPEGS